MPESDDAALWRRLKAAGEEKPWLAEWTMNFAPFLLLFLTVVLGSMLALDEPLAHGQHVNLGVVAKIIDTCVRGYGPLVPLVLFLVQVLLLDYKGLADREVIRKTHGIPLLPPENFALAFLIIWFSLSVFRVLAYMVIAPYHFYCSDHLFLIASVVALLQMKLYLPHHDIRRHGMKFHNAVTACVGWLLVFACCYETYGTVVYYHTVEASWAGFILGALLFGGASHWWMEHHLAPEKDSVSGAYKPMGDDEAKC